MNQRSTVPAASGCRASGAASIALLLAVALPAGAAAADGALEDPAAITAAAEDAARAAIGSQAGEVHVAADAPDARLRLARCAETLRTRLPSGNQPGPGRVTIEVQCLSPQAWRLYVPVQVSMVRPVVIAARPLARDTVLTPGDVKLADREVSSLGYGFIGSLEGAVGQRLTRAISEGAVLTPGLLDAPVLVRRGQAVSVDARSGPVTVSMPGVAQADGALGETIRVRNASSGRILEGVVRSAKSVEVLLR